MSESDNLADSWMRSWRALWQLAPQTLVQPILPGWTFNINSHNSSSPQTELDVVGEYSYGKQLGRMADALAVLVETLLPQAHGQPGPVKDFLDMKREIDQIKTQGSAQRIDQLTRDLERLMRRVEDPAAARRLRERLRKAIGG